MKRFVTFFLITVLISVVCLFFWAKPRLTDHALTIQVQTQIETQLKTAGIQRPTVQVTLPRLFFWSALKSFILKNNKHPFEFNIKIQGQLPSHTIGPPIQLRVEGPLIVTRASAPLTARTNLSWSLNGPLPPLQGDLALSVHLDSNYLPQFPITSEIRIPEIHFSKGSTEVLGSGIALQTQILKYDPHASNPITTNGKISWQSLELMTNTAYRDLGELLPKSWQWDQNANQLELESGKWKVVLPIPFDLNQTRIQIPKQELAPWIQDQLPPDVKLKGLVQISKTENKPIRLNFEKIYIKQDAIKTRIKKIRSQIEIDPKNLKMKRLQFNPFDLEIRFYKINSEIRILGQNIRSHEWEHALPPRTWTSEIQLHPLPMKIAAIQGSPPEFATSLHLPPIPLDEISTAICQERWLSFPVMTEAQFKSIRLSTEQVLFDGSASASFFNGRAILTPRLMDMPLSRARETHLDFHVDHIQLAEFAQFSRFGKIDGILKGHAKNTILRGILPLNTEFRMEIVPGRKSVIVFNSEAMKNFVRLVTEDGINAIPNIAKWFAFGLPSQLLGGYNIDYVGIELNSDGDALVLNTLDPPAIRNLGQHFILKGPRFKIPLESPVYPVRFDKAGLSLFAERIIRQLKSLSLRNEEERNNENSHTCETPDFE